MHASSAARTKAKVDDVREKRYRAARGQDRNELWPKVSWNRITTHVHTSVVDPASSGGSAQTPEESASPRRLLARKATNPYDFKNDGNWQHSAAAPVCSVRRQFTALSDARSAGPDAQFYLIANTTEPATGSVTPRPFPRSSSVSRKLSSVAIICGRASVRAFKSVHSAMMQ